MDNTSNPIFKSPEGEARYRAAYQRAIGLWPVQYESIEIPTRFGVTHGIVSGPPDAPPLFLLHAFFLTATMWYTSIAGLSQHFRTYALDVLGDVNLSVPTNPPKDRPQAAEWLVEVFEQLGVDRPFVAGISYGGFLTLNLALQAPEKVGKIVLLSPAGTFSAVRPEFYVRSFPLLFVQPPSWIRNFVRWGFGNLDEAIADLFAVGVKDCRFVVPPELFPVSLPAGTLATLKTPTLLLLGEKEVIYQSDRALGRARQLLPQIRSKLLPGVGHIMTADQPEYVNGLITEFLLENRSDC